MAEFFAIRATKFKNRDQLNGHSQTSAFQSHKHSPEFDLMFLQQTIGNRAVEQMMQLGQGALLGDRNRRMSIVQSVIKSIGQPLDPAVRASMENSFDHDFSQVRVHTDAKAAESAQKLNARAYTIGLDLVFGAGQYAPETKRGQHVLAHELAHVVQQRQGQVPMGIVQRLEEPPRPAAVRPVTMPFADLYDRRIVQDPTGRAHGITIERRGDELFYHLPPPINATRRVPRPLDTSRTPPVQERIESVRWGGGRPFQIAFTVNFSGIVPPPFTVNIHGEGRLQTLEGSLLRQPPALEVQPEGLEYERESGILSETRPRIRRFEDAHRYHMPGASFSMYVFPSRNIEVVEDATGILQWSMQGRDLRDLRVSPEGQVHVTWNDPVGEVTVRFDLRGPSFSPTGLGAFNAPAERRTLLSNIQSLGVRIIERGSRFTEVELQTAWELLGRWQAATSVVDELRRRGVPALTLIKDVMISGGGSYNTVTGEVIIPGGVEISVTEQRNTIIHELTHAFFQACGLISPRTGRVPEHISREAERLRSLSELSLIEEGPINDPGRSPTSRTQPEWESALSSNEELNTIWRSLHRRFPILDPEGTGDIRGLDVADESRYLGGPRGEAVGHGFDNVTEFISSFVASTLRFQQEMSLTVERSGEPMLARLYERLWDWVNTNLVTLGTASPYVTILR